MTVTTVGLQRNKEPVLRQDSERKLKDLYRLWGRGGFLKRKSSACNKRVWKLNAAFTATLYNQPFKGAYRERQREHAGNKDNEERNMPGMCLSGEALA